MTELESPLDFARKLFRECVRCWPEGYSENDLAAAELVEGRDSDIRDAALTDALKAIAAARDEASRQNHPAEEGLDDAAALLQKLLEP